MAGGHLGSLSRGTRTCTPASLPAPAPSPTSYPDTVRLRLCHFHPTCIFYFWKLVACALVQPRFRFRALGLAVIERVTGRRVVWTRVCSLTL